MSVPAATAAPKPARVVVARPPRAAYAAFVMPLYFLLALSATLVVAFHAPKPHDLALTIAGPAAVTAPVAQGIEQRSPSSFDVTQQTDPAQARVAVERREAVGAIVLGGTQAAPTVTAYIASAEGRSAASAVTSAATGIATGLKTTATTVDVAPLSAADTLGTGLFYIVIYSGIGGYLTLIVLTQVLPRARLRVKYGVSLAAAVLVPLITLGASSIFFGGFEASFGQLMALLGIDALYVLTVALIVVAVEQLLGRSAIFGVAALVVFLNIPSAGGAAPESMLPGFFQALHSFWFGAGAMEAIRDVVYFPGANPVRWIVQLLVWTIALLVITLLIEGVKVIWRLQTIVLREQQHTNTLREHLNLLSVPKQAPIERRALTGPAETAQPAATDVPSRGRTDRDDEPADAPTTTPTAG